jgi:hypothetical protein
MAKKKLPFLIEIPVTFGTVSYNGDVVRVAFRASRGNLTVSQADMHLVGKRVKVTIVARLNGSPDQSSLPGMEQDIELTGYADAKGFAAGTKRITSGLTFAIGSIESGKLEMIAKLDGCVTIHEVNNLPEGDDSEGDE